MDTAAFWDRVAPKYVKHKIADPAGYEYTLGRIAEYLRPTDHVMELGCGTGSTAVRLAGGVARYLATDVSSGMIGFARAKAQEAELSGLEAEVATVEQIEGPFDAVLALNLLHLLRDQEGDLARIAALVKPGGLFISKTACRGAWYTPMMLAIRTVIPVMQLLGKAPYVNLRRPEELEQMITQAGFEVIEAGNHPTRFIVARRLGG